jgi:hypothetical protein
MFRIDKDMHFQVPDAFELAAAQEHRKMSLRYVNRGWLILGIVTLVTLPLFSAQRTQFYFLLHISNVPDHSHPKQFWENAVLWPG